MPENDPSNDQQDVYLDVDEVEALLENPTYVLTKEIGDADPERVCEFLSDAHRLKDIHPLIIEVEVQDHRTQLGDDGTVTSIVMDITDELSFVCGLIKSKTTYRAYMVRPPATRKIYFQTTTKGVTVSHRFDCEPAPQGSNSGGTKVTQTTQVTAPFGLRNYVISTAKKAHTGSLEKLPSALRDVRG